MHENLQQSPPALDYETAAPPIPRSFSRRHLGILLAILLALGGFLTLPFSRDAILPLLLLACSAGVFLATHFLGKLPDEFAEDFDALAFQQRKKEMLTIACTVHANGPIGSWKSRNLLEQPAGKPLKEERTLHLTMEGIGHYTRRLLSSPPQTFTIAFRFKPAPPPASPPLDAPSASTESAEKPPLAILVHLTSPAVDGWHKVPFGFYVHRPPRRDPQLLLFFDPPARPEAIPAEQWPFEGAFAQSGTE